jgi:hypothetical protein
MPIDAPAPPKSESENGNQSPVCLTNNAAERALRGFALGRKSWLFAGSERGADRAAAMTTLIMTAKLNDVIQTSPRPQRWGFFLVLIARRSRPA